MRSCSQERGADTRLGFAPSSNNSLDLNPMKLWGIGNLDLDLKLVVGFPSLGFHFRVGFINTSATAFFLLCSSRNQLLLWKRIGHDRKWEGSRVCSAPATPL